MDNIKKLNISTSQLVKILNRVIQQKDLFTVYLADLDFSQKKTFIKYPIGDIIVEVNGESFNNYKEFISIVKKGPVAFIKTLDNDIFFV